MERPERTIFSGQLVTSVARMGADLGFSRQQVRTALDKLKSTNEITIETTKRYSIITVVNWDEYQSLPGKQPSNQPSKHAPDNHQITNKQPHRKNDKKDTTYLKEEKKAAAPQAFPSGIRSREDDRMHGHAHGTYTDLCYKAALGKTAAQLRKERNAPKKAVAAEFLSSEELPLYQRKEAAVAVLLDAGMKYDQIKAVMLQEA